VIESLCLHRVSRRFGTVQALHEVDLRFEVGQVHAVLGANGAGKSTAIRILAGLDQPDAGSVRLDGKSMRLRSREAAIRHGIGLVPQTGSMVGELTLVENLAVHQPHGLVRRRQARIALAEAAKSAGIVIDLDTQVRRLGRAQQQLGELVVAVAQGARMLLLDEPTSVLDAADIRGLHATLRGLSDSGIGVVLITHRLQEVRSVADTATVLSHGCVSWTGRVAEVDDGTLAHAMVGEMPVERPRPVVEIDAASPVALTLDGVWAATDDLAPVKDVTLRVRAGEIVAVIGTAGNGQRALAETAAGVVAPSRGTRRAVGMAAYVPETRTHSVLPGLSVQWSVVLGRLREPRFARFGLLRTREVRKFAQDLLARFDVRPPDPDLPVAALSGGNVQKLVVGRELERGPAIAVLHAPTQGLDLRAAQAVRELILGAAAAGTAILLVSADHEEAHALAHRVLLLREGRIAGDRAVSRQTRGESAC
jgi:simple sugar transport system ATP-binding protein